MYICTHGTGIICACIYVHYIGAKYVCVQSNLVSM